MSLLFEAIRVKENKLQNIEYHNRRLNFSRKMLFGSNNFIYLEKYISVPDELDDGIYKCRVEYGKYIEKVEFVPYKQRSVQSLKIIKNNEIDYPYKFTDRTELEQLFLLKGDCDDILIVRMEQITDTSLSSSFDIFNFNVVIVIYIQHRIDQFRFSEIINIRIFYFLCCNESLIYKKFPFGSFQEWV
jgi:hypothetical protein